MILIKYRLDIESEIQYIDLVKKIIDLKERIKLSNRIKYLIKMLEYRGYSGSVILNQKAEMYKIKYPYDYFLSMWLVISFEQIDSIKKFLREKFLDSDLKKISEYIQSLRGVLKEIQSYDDLKRRRKNKYKNSSVTDFLTREIFYDYLYNCFNKFKIIYDESFSIKDINNWIINETDVKVCPYCNLTYTYNRGSSTTAQLDHFFPKTEYPMFALCFYNLIPSCPSCNRIKSASQKELTSPYEKDAYNDLKITWDYGNFSNKKEQNDKLKLKELEKNIEIKIHSSKPKDNNNIEVMKLLEAYNQHKDYASEVIKKMHIYMNKDAQKLISAMCKKIGISSNEIERFYFANYLDKEQLAKRPLSKMTNDFFVEYKEFCKK